MYGCILTLGLIAFDVATGLLQAWFTKTLNSTNMRQGGVNKLTELVALFGSWLFNQGLQSSGLSIPFPVYETVVFYLCTMELISVLENLCEINPKLNGLFAPYLQKIDKK